MGLLKDDKEYIGAIIEMSNWSTGSFMRRMFASLMVSGQMSRPKVGWSKTLEHMTEDILHIQRTVLGAPGMLVL